MIAALCLAPPGVSHKVGSWYYAGLATYTTAKFVARNETVRDCFKAARELLSCILLARSKLLTLFLPAAPEEMWPALAVVALLSACGRLVAERRVRTPAQKCVVWCAKMLYTGVLWELHSLAFMISCVMKLVAGVVPYVGRLAIVVLCLSGAVIISIIVTLPPLLAQPFLRQHAEAYVKTMYAEKVASEAAQGNFMPMASTIVSWAISAAPTALAVIASVYAPGLQVPLAMALGHPVIAAGSRTPTVAETRGPSMPIVTEMP